MNKALKIIITGIAALLLVGGGIAGGFLVAQAQGTQQSVVAQDASPETVVQAPLEPTLQAEPLIEETAIPDNQTGGQPGFGYGRLGMRGMMNWGVASIPSEYANVTNPLAFDSDSIAQGQSLYAANCATCHGETGLGDGPAATGLNPAPSPLAFTTHMSPDDYLYYRINEGGGFEPFNSAMPAWNNTLDEDDIWAIITYLRSLSGPGMMMGYNGWQSSEIEPGEVVSEEQAQDIAEQYISTFGADNLVIDSITSQQAAYYVKVNDSNTNSWAFDFYIDRATGSVYPQMGPGMMRDQGVWDSGTCCDGWGQRTNAPQNGWGPHHSGTMGGWGHGMWGGRGSGWQVTPNRP